MNDGFPVLALLAQIRAQLPEVADFVHFGATTQDIMDTAAVLQCKAALNIIGQSLSDLIAGLRQRCEQHRHTVMAGRTHTQQALPITFGLKIATWLAPLLRHQERFSQLERRLLVVQFGGAVGTLAALGTQGLEVQRQLALELNLLQPVLPWHTQRDAVAELGGCLSLLTASLGKMAQDILLLAQSEIAEVRESEDSTRGGSSTMPQKSNPIRSELILAAAR